MSKYQKTDIRSIGDLSAADGGRTLTPVFKGSSHPILVKITKTEFEKVKGNIDAMKDLAIKKLNESSNSKVKNIIREMISKKK